MGLAHMRDEHIMDLGHTDPNTEQAVLNTLQRCGVMTVDEVLTVMQPDVSWNEVFLAIDRLSRKQLIALSRIGSTYQLACKMQERQ